jgi:hypothetical protein
MVKHDLTVRIAGERVFDVSSDPTLRKSLLSYNALTLAVTRVTQRAVFWWAPRRNYPQIFPKRLQKNSNSSPRDAFVIVEIFGRTTIQFAVRE